MWKNETFVYLCSCIDPLFSRCDFLHTISNYISPRNHRISHLVVKIHLFYCQCFLNTFMDIWIDHPLWNQQNFPSFLGNLLSLFALICHLSFCSSTSLFQTIPASFTVSCTVGFLTRSLLSWLLLEEYWLLPLLSASSFWSTTTFTTFCLHKENA